MRRFPLLLAGLLALAPLAAQEHGLIFKAGLLNTQGDARDMTRKPFGHAFELGYETKPAGYGVGFLFHLGHLKAPGRDGAAQTYNLAANTLGVDLVYKPFKALPALSVQTGPSFHQWQVEARGGTGAPTGEQGIRFGWRLGLAYEINDRWQASLAYHLAEWRSNPDAEYASGANPSRPAYITLMAGYRF